MHSAIETLIEERVESATQRGGFTPQDYAHVRKHIVHKYPSGVAEAACSLIQKHGPGSQFYSTIQEVAGRLLEDLQPPISLSIEDALGRVLDSWDPSVEQYPIYLRLKFGSEAVLSKLRELEARPLSPRGKQAVKTMRWWLTGPEKNG